MILPVTLPYDIVPILWNPSIHKSVFLPSPGVRLPSSYEPMEYLGFGYDPITDDYKVVRLVYLHGWDERSFQGEEPSVVQIYSLRTNAWRTIPGPGHRYIIKEQSLSVFVNGSVHWLAHVGNVDTDSEDDYSDDDPPCNVIFTFNIRDEVFRKMDVPKYYEDTFDLNMMVALVGDKLGLVPDLENVVGFAKNEVIVNKYGTLLSYNPRKRERSDPGIEALSTSFYMDTYMESLVLLNVEDDALRKQAKSSTASKGIRAKVGVSFKQAGKGSARLMQKLMLKPRKSRKREGSATRTNTLQTGESSSKQMKKAIIAPNPQIFQVAIWVAVRGVELKEMEMGSTRFCYISKASGAGTSLETELAATTENIGPSRRHQENTAARSPNHSE
nr:f-box/kelch-repeat protein [Quercus suber]